MPEIEDGSEVSRMVGSDYQRAYNAGHEAGYSEGFAAGEANIPEEKRVIVRYTTPGGGGAF